MKGKTKWLQVFNINKLQEIVLIFFVCSMHYTVNSLVSDHRWCMTKSSLTGGGRLREKSRKRTHIELINVITLSYYLASKNEANRELLIAFNSNSAWN